MIRYTLKCADGHSFESWFKSSEAFEKLQVSGMVACAVCGQTDVQKSLMAPKVTTSRRRAKPGTEPEAPAANTPAAISAPASEMEARLAEMRKYVEANSDYVGRDFAKEARAMHEGAAPERSIYGEVNGKEAKALVEDGVPVMPLPFTPKRQTN